MAVTARSTSGAPTAMPGTIDQTVAEISGAGGHAVAIPADLSRPDDRTRLVEETAPLEAQLPSVTTRTSRAST